MAYSKMLRELFPEIDLHAEDLLLLETFQLAYLPERAAPEEFACLLREYPYVHRFLLTKYPPIASFLAKLLEEQKPSGDTVQIEEQCQEALWEIADLIVYTKHPELYDRNTRIQWNIEEITSIASLEGKTVADVGAGSGRIAFLAAPLAQTVFAVDPITSFRSFMKKKALEQKIDNLFVMDGTLDSIPLPDDSLDVLLTSNAIGWNLEKELMEIERVVRQGGHAIHLLHSDPQQENPLHQVLTSIPWKYSFKQYADNGKMKIRYYKSMAMPDS